MQRSWIRLDEWRCTLPCMLHPAPADADTENSAPYDGSMPLAAASAPHRTTLIVLTSGICRQIPLPLASRSLTQTVDAPLLRTLECAPAQRPVARSMQRTTMHRTISSSGKCREDGSSTAPAPSLTSAQWGLSRAHGVLLRPASRVPQRATDTDTLPCPAVVPGFCLGATCRDAWTRKAGTSRYLGGGIEGAGDWSVAIALPIRRLSGGTSACAFAVRSSDARARARVYHHAVHDALCVLLEGWLAGAGGSSNVTRGSDLPPTGCTIDAVAIFPDAEESSSARRVHVTCECDADDADTEIQPHRKIGHPTALAITPTRRIPQQ
ncbi:hypothetical protein C8R45DRAFT_934444 [Mycena sanguinolenta]|nr:hypothetical protein C8R45DRAFT_944143 [Mycena sanguinolenta]KAJ6473005.1 hypothetical protein C8R45DRAFT_936043 [Mycena sanguinolenta]KAJ6477796.1 hypothetical protein C8R45DRAFT_934444 [Mycena sanguinolenta]